MEDIEDLVKRDASTEFQQRELRPVVSLHSRRLQTKSPNAAVNAAAQGSSAAEPPRGVPGVQSIYLKTFGCSHNQSDSEYMAGQLSSYGYLLTEDSDSADVWLINTCTVKNPSQSAMETLVRRAKELRKALVVAGCVPQGNSNLKDLEGVSIVGVQQIDRVVEVVEETLRGHEVRLLRRRSLPSLDLPKVRKNKFIEIVPINVGCLGACTYCKTKHARGHLGSYAISALVERVKTVVADGVKEIWLSSEDTGAYGRDLGTDLPTLLQALVAELPSDRSTMLRIGMTNPPYILQHLDAVAEILRHPCVYSFLHVPVQSGSDAVLTAMKREYTVAEFRKVVDTLIKLVPNIHIATDVICGFPGESAEDFDQTLALIQEYKFAEVHISQFYPRPGTPAARMKKIPTNEVKRRSRLLTSVFEDFSPHEGMEDRIEMVWVTDVASDGVHLVGHTKSYTQVLLPASNALLGSNCEVKITSFGRWSVIGEPLNQHSKYGDHAVPSQLLSSKAANGEEAVVSSSESTFGICDSVRDRAPHASATCCESTDDQEQACSSCDALGIPADCNSEAGAVETAECRCNGEKDMKGLQERLPPTDVGMSNPSNPSLRGDAGRRQPRSLRRKGFVISNPRTAPETCSDLPQIATSKRVNREKGRAYSSEFLTPMFKVKKTWLDPIYYLGILLMITVAIIYLGGWQGLSMLR